MSNSRDDDPDKVVQDGDESETATPTDTTPQQLPSPSSAQRSPPHAAAAVAAPSPPASSPKASTSSGGNKGGSEMRNRASGSRPQTREKTSRSDAPTTNGAAASVGVGGAASAAPGSKARARTPRAAETAAETMQRLEQGWSLAPVTRYERHLVLPPGVSLNLRPILANRSNKNVLEDEHTAILLPQIPSPPKQRGGVSPRHRSPEFAEARSTARLWLREKEDSKGAHSTSPRQTESRLSSTLASRGLSPTREQFVVPPLPSGSLFEGPTGYPEVPSYHDRILMSGKLNQTLEVSLPPGSRQHRQHHQHAPDGKASSSRPVTRESSSRRGKREPPAPPAQSAAASS